MRLDTCLPAANAKSCRARLNSRRCLGPSRKRTKDCSGTIKDHSLGAGNREGLLDHIKMAFALWHAFCGGDRGSSHKLNLSRCFNATCVRQQEAAPVHHLFIPDSQNQQWRTPMTLQYASNKTLTELHDFWVVFPDHEEAVQRIVFAGQALLSWGSAALHGLSRLCKQTTGSGCCSPRTVLESWDLSP